MGFVMVGLGGALGAIGRYSISLIPFKMNFPVLTMATNFLGALLIGFIVGFGSGGRMGRMQVLFWKTGVCGGFTTFSTFSQEAFQLMEEGRTAAGILYVVLSVIMCLTGVSAGQYLGRRAAGS